MVTKKDIKDYDFQNIDQYFDYVFESIINGQRQQARDLILKFSQRQKNQFHSYLIDENIFGGEAVNEALQILKTK